ncbi:17938_t:CDS:2 [Cetraspora pellucida]|uniref:17938_t:CDS:1 n=1 Tax=Cetraspora pellucida TaxID=1433469 RepID=A0A9N9NYN7_9GLOM|nr:17938_t:CDS:2 [Cetraspora pellucida]
MKKHKRIYMPEQKAARNEAKRKRLASMPPEEQLKNQNTLPLPLASQLSDNDHNLLKNFRNAVVALRFNFCSTCKESFPTIMLVKTTGLCSRCSRESLIPKRFSAENDIDPEILAELPQLSQVEEMLITQILSILTVYKLQELITKLPQNPSTIDALVIRKFGQNLTSFQDFKDILQTIPEDGFIFNRLNTIYDNNLSKDMAFLNNNDILSTSEDYIKHSFIPNSVSKETEEVATYSEINQLVNLNSNILINWPTIKDNPINEFEEVGYIMKAFPTLFPKGKADLRSTQRYRQVYSAEYFEHLIKYHDRRFVQHKRFHYFALNSIMR